MTEQKTSPETPKAEPMKLVKMRAVVDLKLMKRELDPKFDQQSIEMADIKKDQEFFCKPEYAKDLEGTISGNPKWAGNRFESELSDSYNNHVRAVRVS